MHMKNTLLSIVELTHLPKLWEVKIYPVLGIERKEHPSPPQKVHS